MSDLKGKTAVVTGGAKGLGLAMAQTLEARGAHVAIWDLDADGLAAAKTSLRGNYMFDSVNVADTDSVAAGATKLAEAGKDVDILINNAGISRDKLILKMDDDVWDSVINVNLRSQFVTSKAFLGGMKDRGWGRIVNISSRAWLGAKGQTNYSASKGAVISFTRSLALEFAPFGITVNAIAPGIHSTPMFRELPEDRQAQLAQTVPMKRIGDAEDVANAAAFFCDPNAHYVTGQLIYVCGGRSLSAESV